MKQLCLSAIALLLVLPSSLGELAFSDPEWYLPTSDGCRLFVQEFGHGKETIIVLHGGWGAEHSYLLDAFEGVDRHYHLVFYDQRGHGQSGDASPESFTVPQLGHDLESVLAVMAPRGERILRAGGLAEDVGRWLAAGTARPGPPEGPV